MRTLIPLLALALYAAACSPEQTNTNELSIEEQTKNIDVPPEIAQHKESFIIPKNSTTYTEFSKVGFNAQEIHRLVEDSKPIQSLSMIPAQTSFDVIWESSEKEKMVQLDIKLSKTRILSYDLNAEIWEPSIVELPIKLQRQTFSGIVKSSLWDSASESGMETSLIPELSEIFAWQIDFSREVRQGDLWRIVVDQKFVNGESIGWGPILAAQYNTSAGDNYSGIRYPQDANYASYYQEDGSSLRRMFLKSPIKYGRISSHFSNKRFHPILKTNRPHLGVDYAAPMGTPIRSVGDGRVVYVGRNGGSGKMVKIRHNAIYTTAYLHLNGYGKDVRNGAKIEQGQTIGYVGQTGLATGPHLHFAFYKNNSYVDPLGVKFPSADPVASSERQNFEMVSQKIITELPDWQSVSNVAEQPKIESLLPDLSKQL